MESELDREEAEMKRRRIEIAIVGVASVVAFIWTLSSAVALMPIVYYLVSKGQKTVPSAA